MTGELSQTTADVSTANRAGRCEPSVVAFCAAQRGTCVRVLRAARRYEHLDISGFIGISNAHRHALLALGALDRVRAARESV